MNQDQRKFTADKLGTLGNIAAAALIFSQFLSKGPFLFNSILFGIVFWITCYVAGYFILKGCDQE